MAMAVLSSSLPPLSNSLPTSTSSSNLCCPRIYSSSSYHLRRRLLRPIIASQLCAPQTFKIDKSSLVVAETVSEDQLWAAACLRIRSFYQFGPSYGIDDHKGYLAEREFEALKERVAGKREGFRRVSCINATIPLSQISSFSDDLCAACKFTHNGEDRVVVGTLDLNQCVSLPDEITGMKPQGIGADFLRAYLSNVCVAKELHRNGLGSALVAKSKMVAQEWGITDLYVHFAVDNEPAKQLYMKSGFIYENDEPAWKARFLDRPRRILLWTGLPVNYDV
ncbi:uncharacterized protein LOC117924495 [Vitis riparia]|uniref:uncharacterized protein LOC117924495 n=1 Tax=Vitis riparia TaxID=96939 RepID=UPI00155AA8F4|nr:uncharacterized protein LOC117924495 [Vitis riparia]